MHRHNLRALLMPLLLTAALLIRAWPASAHQGPPFPILVDRQIGPCVVSVWADPDIGPATFFIILEPPKGGTIPNDLKVEVGVQPVSGRLAEVIYPATREALRGQVQYQAVAEFDAQEFWKVRIILHSSQGDGQTILQVEATPPGFGRWDVLLYLFPFAALGLLWLRAVLRRRGRKGAKTS
ncbi:MAG TPA: hypothetical protein VJ302_02770 [Blastocatellia bacterium]|nr:hypothetical protein [Blastocatellia bacterium]